MGCCGTKTPTPDPTPVVPNNKPNSTYDNTEEDDAELKLVCVGDNGVGKSAFFTRIAEKVFKENDQTIVEQRNITYTLQNGKKVDLELSDTCGQEKFRTVTTTYYRSAQGAVLAFDLTSVESFANLKNWLNEIQTYKSETLTVKILVGMKSDLHRKVSREEAENFADSCAMTYYECSSKTDTDVTKCFDDFIMEILKKRNSK